MTLYLHNWTSFTDKFGRSESDALRSALSDSSCAAQAQSTIYRNELTAGQPRTAHNEALPAQQHLAGTICDPQHHTAMEIGPKERLHHCQGLIKPAKTKLGSILQLKRQQPRHISKASRCPQGVP